MKKVICRLLCLFVCLLLCTSALASCAGKGNPFVKNGISSLTVNKKGDLEVSISFNSLLTEERKGQKVELYELLPGEDLSSLAGKEPLARKKIARSVTLRFPLIEDGRTKLYSSFVLKFSDGTLFSESGTYIERVATAESDPLALLWSGAPKGLSTDLSTDAATLGVGHALTQVRLSELLAVADTPFQFGNETYYLCAAALASLDESLRAAEAAGMQPMLLLTPDLAPDVARDVAILDHLAQRYTGSTNGSLSTILIGAHEALSAKDAALWVRLSHIALTSRVENGRVYAVCDEDTTSDSLVFFADLGAELSLGGALNWGAAVSLAPTSSRAWEDSDPSKISIPNLAAFSKALSTGSSNAPAWLGVCDLRISAEDPEAQAVSYVYAYRKALSAGANLFLYGSHVSRDYGLRRTDLSSRPVLELFRRVDTGLRDEDVKRCKNLLGDELWESLSDPPLRTCVSGVANAGDSGLKTEPLFSFTAEETHGFSAVGGKEEPEIRKSSSWNSSVLCAWVSPELANGETGLSVILKDASALDGATSLSAKTLMQIPNADGATLRLRLIGRAKNGSVLIYESALESPTTTWQSSTFSISNFVADADLSSPCVLTLVTDSAPVSEGEEDSSYVFWLKGIELRRPTGEFPWQIAAVAVLAGILLGLFLTLLLYRRAARRRG